MPESSGSFSDLVLLGRRILEKEARALAGLVTTLDETFAQACQMLFECRGTLLLTGMGKSGIVARKWASTFSSTGTRAYFINPAEAPHGDMGIIHSGDVLIALSYSGETEELTHVLRHAKQEGVPCIAITGNAKSLLATQASVVLSVALSEEACPLGLAPTTSTTLMMALGDAMAMTLMQMHGFTERDFARLHPGGALGRQHWLRVSELMHRGASLPVVKADDAFERVLSEMTRKCLGLAIVMDGDTLLGVITDGDLRRGFQGKRIHPGTLASELMTNAPRTIPIGALASEAREMMERHSIQQLLVTDQKRVAGVIHLYDLLRAKVV